jgi:hypothetical protein
MQMAAHHFFDCVMKNFSVKLMRLRSFGGITRNPAKAENRPENKMIPKTAASRTTTREQTEGAKNSP